MCNIPRGYLSCLLLVVTIYSCSVWCQSGSSIYETFFLHNTEPSGLPRSYYVLPGYFSSIPEDERPHNVEKEEYVASCGGIVQPPELDAYEFQTEELLTAAGLNLYDGACWSIAMSLLGAEENQIATNYTKHTLYDHKTLQFQNIKATAPCAGLLYPYGDCIDENQDGSCGFCYGSDLLTMTEDNAYFFRMISDYWCFEGTLDARCPSSGNPWCWNEYTPVTGENGWANLLGTLQSIYISAGGNVNAVPNNSPSMLLATRILTAISAMRIPNGGVYYAPYNTYNVHNPNVGSTVSTENNASLLSGLYMLYNLINAQSSGEYKHLLPTLQTYIDGITSYIKASYDPNVRYFRQGGSYNIDSGEFTWVTTPFATDCQTWVISVLGKDVIDGWFGEGTTEMIWEETKIIAGYKYNAATGIAQGLGFSANEEEQVFSGEWTLGACNMLRIVAQQYEQDGNAAKAAELLSEADIMLKAIRDELTITFDLPSSSGTVQATAILYANKRYYIPFGWWANVLPSMASTAWMQMLDSNFNPFILGGAYVPASF